MCLFDYDSSLGRIRVEVAKERIVACGKGPYEHHSLRISRDHFLALEFVTFEFLRRRIVVLNQELDLGIGGYVHVRRFKAVVTDT